MSSDRTVPTLRPADARGQVIQGFLQQAAQKFDPDVLVAMDRRDNALLEDEIVHGVQSRAFVYSIPIGGGKKAEGVTVVGARQLASVYGGIQAIYVSTLLKRGGMFISRSYPYGGFPGRLEVQKIPDLEYDEDFYEVVIEVHDIKTGNKIPSSQREFRFEKRSEESMRKNPQQDPVFERPHLEKIAFSKAYRNAVTTLIPQDAVLQFKTKNLALNTDQNFVGSLMEEKRSGVLRYAAARAIGVDREAMERLTFEQIAGLADAAREGSLDGFTQSAQALGIVVGGDEEDRSQRRVVSTPRPSAERQVSNGQQQGGGEQQQKTEAKKEAAPKQQDGKSATATTTTKPDEVKKASAPKQEQPFDHHALDEFGNEVLTPDNFALHFSSPVDFAAWYRGACEASDNELALESHNADALADAYLDPAARDIIDAIQAPSREQVEKPIDPVKQQTSDPATLQPVLMILFPDGKPNLIAYDEKLAEDLKKVTAEGDLNTWVLVNQQVYRSPKLPGSRSNFTARIEPMIEEKRKTIQAVVRDHDMERAVGLIKDLENLDSLEGLEAIGKSGAIRAFLNRMKDNRPDDIYKMLRDANVAAEARLKAATATGPSTGAPAEGMPEHDPR